MTFQLSIMNKQKTKLLDFHRDMWFELFAYFYTDELFYTFLHLSNEIDSILFNANHLRLHVRINAELSPNTLSQVNPTRIISLSIEESKGNNIHISEMTYLQSVSIKGSNISQWMEHLLSQMMLLKEIKKISLSLFYNDRGSYLLDLALRIPSLKQLYFKDKSNWEIDYHPQSIIPSRNLSLEKLHFNFYCPFNYMIKTLSSLPNIRILRLKLLRGNEDLNENFSELFFHQMQTVHLTLCDVSFDRILLFLERLSTVQRIKIDGNIWGTNVIAYFRSENWFRLLDMNTKVINIEVDLDLRQDYSNLSTNNIGVINYDEFEKLGLQLTLYTIKGIINL